MLKEKSIEVPYVRIFKLQTGEEIITKVVGVGNVNYLIEKPLQMVMGAGGLQFAPFMMMVEKDSKFPLRVDAVIADGPPEPSLESQYESITTGIALPKKSAIIT